MIIRDLKLSDVDSIDDIWQRCHKGINGIPKRKYLVTDAVTENSKITGYGVVRYFAEASLYLDKCLSRYQQAKSFKLLMEKAIADAKRQGLDSLNVVVVDEKFKNLLRERYQFEDRGTILTLGL